jgi:hypothetical protein
MSLAEKLFGSFSDRELKKINPLTKQVLALEGKYQAMSDAELQAQTPALKQKLADGKTLDDILPDAFAVCREAAWRVLGMKHFPVQVTGGIALHRGDIAEMQTGEGKTLVATLPAYLNALTGEGVHIVTVNDYLAKRDSEWMGKLYRWLGLSVGLIVQGMDGDARREAYNADITYGTNNEFGFDYLRDNMVTYKDNMVQRGHAYAVVDEVDSILIDEARTPLIISGRGEDSSSLYTQVDRFVRTLRKSVVVELEDKVETDEQADRPATWGCLAPAARSAASGTPPLRNRLRHRRGCRSHRRRIGNRPAAQDRGAGQGDAPKGIAREGGKGSGGGSKALGPVGPTGPAAPGHRVPRSGRCTAATRALPALQFLGPGTGSAPSSQRSSNTQRMVSGVSPPGSYRITMRARPGADQQRNSPALCKKRSPSPAASRESPQRAMVRRVSGTSGRACRALSQASAMARCNTFDRPAMRATAANQSKRTGPVSWAGKTVVRTERSSGTGGTATLQARKTMPCCRQGRRLAAPRD